MENTKQEQRKHIVALWVERAEKEKDISLFDLIATNCDTLQNYGFYNDKDKMIKELCYFITDLLEGFKCCEADFIEQLKDYREEFFENEEE